MKRFLRYTAIGLAVLTLLLAFGAWWLFGTSSGARWVLNQIPRFAPVTLEMQSLQGSLWGPLRIEGLNASWPQGSARIRELSLDWVPQTLVFGRIGLRELTVSGARIQDNRPQTPAPPGLNWPQQITIPLLPLTVRSLVLDDITYQRQEQPPVRIDRAEADLRLSRQKLSLRDLSFTLPQVRMTGMIEIGLGRPGLRTDLAVIPAKPVAGMNEFRVRTDLDAAASPALAAGPVDVSAYSEKKKTIDAAARATVTNKSLLLENLKVSRPGRKGSVTGRVDLAITGETPAVDAELLLNNLDLSQDIPGLNSLNGTVAIKGSIQEYRGKLSLASKGTGWKAGRLQADFKGTAGSFALSSIDADWLNGTVTGSAGIDWKEVLSFQASLRARGVNPQTLASEWNGSINANLNASGSLPEKGEPQGRISLRLLDSTLRGQPLTGSVQASIKQKSVLIDRLLVSGRGFDVKASGSLEERISYSITLRDLSLLLTGAEGRASAEGWIRKAGEMLSGQVTASAKNVLFNGIKAGSVSLNGRLEPGKEHPFSVETKVNNAVFKGLRADSLLVDASGTLAVHTIDISLRSSIATIAAKATGEYSDNAWQGAIVALSGRDELGEWSLKEPASVAVSGSGAALSRLVLTGAKGERIEAQADIRTDPLAGSFMLEWSELNISRLNAWVSGIRLSGVARGAVSGKILPGEGLVVAADASVSRGTLTRRIEDLELKAEIKTADLLLNWEGQRLEGKLSLALSEYGRIDAAVSLPVPARIPVAPDADGALRASITGQVRESGTLSFLFPGLVQESRGQIELDIRAGGTWASPAITGSAALANAGAYFPAAGIHVTDLQVAAVFEKTRVTINSFSAKSGPGQITGKAAVDLEGWRPVRYEGSFQGERFQAMHLPQLRMLASPEIEFQGTPRKLSARGSVRVPELLIYGAPAQGPVEPSEDVVIIRGPSAVEEDKKARRLGLDIEIKVILGDRVIVKAEGIDAKLDGQFLLSVTAFDRITARGEIRVVEGKYSTYGVSLSITRGRLFFTGGPVRNPTLDILAVRTVNEVKAGVLVTGNLQSPVIKLYSEPPMPDADVLAYIVLGHPLGQDREQASLILRAANALLSRGESVALQDQLRNRLGVDVLDIEAGQGELSRSLVTIGKYLSSRLYVSYGYALFSGESLLRMKYKFSKRLEVESRSGQTSGIDLYYTVQFD